METPCVDVDQGYDSGLAKAAKEVFLGEDGNKTTTSNDAKKIGSHSHPETDQLQSLVTPASTSGPCKKALPGNQDPLSIPELVRIILQDHDLKLEDIKACRLVNKLWKETVAPKFKSQSCAKLLSDASKSIEKFRQEMDKPTAFRFKSYSLHCAGSDLDTFCNFFSDYCRIIQELKFTPPEAEAYNGSIENRQQCFRKIIHSFESVQNLTSLTLGFVYEGLSHPFKTMPIEFRTCRNFYKLRTLKSLNLQALIHKESIEFSHYILRRASNIEDLSLELQTTENMDERTVIKYTEALSKSVTSQRIRKLRVVKARLHFFQKLKQFPELEELELVRCSVSSLAEMRSILGFLNDHTSGLQKMAINFLSFANSSGIAMYSRQLAILPNMKFLECLIEDPRRELFFIMEGQVPNLIRITLTGEALAYGLRLLGRVESVQELVLVSMNTETIRRPWMPILQNHFPNLTKLWMTQPDPDTGELIQIFEHLQDLEELTLTYRDLSKAEELLTGLDKSNLDDFFENFLERQDTVSNIQLAVNSAFLGTPRKNIREMKNLKKFHLKLLPRSDSDSEALINPIMNLMTDACIFMSFLLIQPPLEELILSNIQVSERSGTLLRSYIDNFNCRTRE